MNLGITEYKKVGEKRISMPCPVHGGDNPAGCCLFIDNKLMIPTWKCYTHKCEEKVGKTLLNLISYLSNKNIHETLKWLDIKSETSEDELDNMSFIMTTGLLDRKKRGESIQISRDRVLNMLEIPSKYYIDRGFSEEVLIKYDIGDCFNIRSKMFNKVVVPIYDKNHEYVIGCTGRSLYEKCLLCDTFHSPKKICPNTPLEKCKYPKWMNSEGFYSENFFYNYWFAIESIRKTKKVFLVEGQSDVWRFVESGIFNVLGMFGSALKSEQKITLEKSGVEELILFTDPDSAGEACRKKIEEDVGRLYNISHIQYDKDPSDCVSKELLNLAEKFL